ncbi:MAG: putative RDD family membrane protein YckC [Pseudohongiellaceae bacterium]|jgi:uncharacterized RDD family membrane protein YckC
MNTDQLEYVGFWARFGATLIDSLLIVAITLPLLFFVYGSSYFLSEASIKGPADFLISYVLPAIAIIVFWHLKQATPGKMLIGAKIVDAKTGSTPASGKLVIRYFAYIISLIPLGLGYFWIAFDARKQAWHDKLAGTVVVRSKDKSVQKLNSIEYGRSIDSLKKFGS